MQPFRKHPRGLNVLGKAKAVPWSSESITGHHLRPCPFLKTSPTSRFIKFWLKLSGNPGENSIAFGKSCTWFLWMRFLEDHAESLPAVNLLDFSWRQQAWSSRACPTPPVRCKPTYFPWNAEPGDTRTSPAKITRFGSSEGCSASLRLTQSSWRQTHIFQVLQKPMPRVTFPLGVTKPSVINTRTT